MFEFGIRYVLCDVEHDGVWMIYFDGDGWRWVVELTAISVRPGPRLGLHRAA